MTKIKLQKIIKNNDISNLGIDLTDITVKPTRITSKYTVLRL